MVQTDADVDAVEVPDPSKVAYLTQTTLSVDDAAGIIERLAAAIPADRRPDAERHLLRHAESQRRCGNSPPRPTWCWSSAAEQFQQPAAGRVGPACGVATHLIDGPGDIDMAWFSAEKGGLSPFVRRPTLRSVPASGPFRQRGTVPFRSGEQTVVVTAGASAPEALVQKCVRLLQERFGARWKRA